MPKLSPEIAARIAAYDESAENRRIAAESAAQHAEMVGTWRAADYAVEPRRKHFWSPIRWYVVDGSPDWEMGPFLRRESAEDRRESLARTRSLILRGERGLCG